MFTPPPYELEVSVTGTGVVNIPNISGTNAPSVLPLLTVCSAHGLEVKGVGATPSAWAVVLQGSISGKNWTTILSHSSSNSPAQSDGQLVWNNNATNEGNWPNICKYVRIDVTALTLGSASALAIYAVGRL
jgi:hypothetical protein